MPALLLVVGMFFLPESPRYMVETGHYDEAMKTLRRLHYDGTNDEWIQTEYTEIRATIDAENSVTKPGWLIMFKVPQWRTRLLCVCPRPPFPQSIQD